MKASEFGYTYDDTRPDGKSDDLVAYLETDAGKAAIEDHDSHWSEVMKLCEKHGFIIQAAGGAARICTNEAYAEANGHDELAKRLRMCNVEMGDAQ